MKRPRTIPYAIAFRRPIVTAAGRWAVRRGFWIVQEEQDWIGLGDAPHLGPYVIDGGGGGWRSRRRSLNAALELARLDIEGQRTGRSIASVLSEDPLARVAVNALLFSRDIAEGASEAVEAVARGFRTLKLKVAIGPPQEDVARIAEVRRAVGFDVRIRIDANGGWDIDTAQDVLDAVERYDIEYVEDPVAGDLRAIRSRTGIPVAADVQTRDQARAVIEEKGADFLILKPVLLGGIRSARDIAMSGIDAGLGVVITSVFESAIGVGGAVHLAASLPGQERAHGLATVCLLEEHPARGLEPPLDGFIQVPMLPGLGVDLEGISP